MRAPRTPDWISAHDALERVLAHAYVLGAEEIGLHDAFGRVLAADAVAPTDQPPWANSGMDGYAVRAADVRGASRDRTITLQVLQHIAAGDAAGVEVLPGTAVRIMTGAPVPAGADSVIRIEHTAAPDEHVVVIHNDMDAGSNVRPQGEDVRAGEVAVPAGRILRASEIGVLAMTGHARVRVQQRPRVAILATGNELASVDAAASARADHRILDANGPALAAAALEVGAVPQPLGIARDTVDDIVRAVQPALDADVLVVTAGASMGDFDVVKDALEQLGMRLDFWRARIRPGSPLAFGTIERPDRPPLLVYSLPGNPVSAVVTFELYVKPVLRRMLARRGVHAPVRSVRAPVRIASKTGLVHFLRATLTEAADGVLEARLTGAQGSGMLTSIARADALVIVPEDESAIEAGGYARAVLLNPGDEAHEHAGY